MSPEQKSESSLENYVGTTRLSDAADTFVKKWSLSVAFNYLVKADRVFDVRWVTAIITIIVCPRNNIGLWYTIQCMFEVFLLQGVKPLVTGKDQEVSFGIDV